VRGSTAPCRSRAGVRDRPFSRWYRADRGSQNDAVATARTVLSTAGNGHPPFQPEAAGSPERLRPHDLRHTYAAFCIASTAHPYAVMRKRGVTYNTYGHLFPERDAEITDRLEDLYRRGGVDFPWTRPGRWLKGDRSDRA
jgi:integrase